MRNCLPASERLAERRARGKVSMYSCRFVGTNDVSNHELTDSVVKRRPIPKEASDIDNGWTSFLQQPRGISRGEPKGESRKEEANYTPTTPKQRSDLTKT